jgi:hypothetical protein
MQKFQGQNSPWTKPQHPKLFLVGQNTTQQHIKAIHTCTFHYCQNSSPLQVEYNISILVPYTNINNNAHDHTDRKAIRFILNLIYRKLEVLSWSARLAGYPRM